MLRYCEKKTFFLSFQKESKFKQCREMKDRFRKNLSLETNFYYLNILIVIYYLYWIIYEKLCYL